MKRFTMTVCVACFSLMLVLSGCSRLGLLSPSVDGDRLARAIADAEHRVAPARTIADGNPSVVVDGFGGPGVQRFVQAGYDARLGNDLLVEANGDEGGVDVVRDEERLEPLPSFSEVLKRDVKDLPRSLWEDTKRVYSDKTNLAILLIAGGTSLTVRNTVDDRFEDHFDKHRTLDSSWGDVGGVAGNPGLHLAVAAAAYTYGLKTYDTKTYHVGKTLLNALIINDLSTLLFKSASTRAPNGESHAWPSGHTSSTVCLAAVLDEVYGHWVGVPLYALSAFVGFERMDDREHHFSDVIFGAALGYVVGKTVARGHSPEIFGGRIIPYVDPYEGAQGLAWVKGF